MGGGGSSRRYLGGMKPDKYFKTVAWPENEETLTMLGFSFDNAFKIFEAFIEIDADNSSEMSVEEFHRYLGQNVTKFSERVFGILDTDASGMDELQADLQAAVNAARRQDHSPVRAAAPAADEASDGAAAARAVRRAR